MENNNFEKVLDFLIEGSKEVSQISLKKTETFVKNLV